MASSTLLLIYFSLFLQLFSAAAQSSSGKITIGTSISAVDNSSSWSSPSGDFAFGFRSLASDKDLFLLSIWYDKIPSKTIVWYAKGGNPAPRGSRVELNAQGLVLTGPQGDELWSSEPIIGNVAYGVMNDTGNLELLSSNSDKLWESFKHPADTMLPSQTLERGDQLSSRLSANNFSKGRFIFRLQQDGNLVLNTINLPTDQRNDPYYATETSEANSSGIRVVFNQSGYMYLSQSNDQKFPLTSGFDPSGTNFYYRATINFDGVFTQFRCYGSSPMCAHVPMFVAFKIFYIVFFYMGPACYCLLAIKGVVSAIRKRRGNTHTKGKTKTESFSLGFASFASSISLRSEVLPWSDFSET